MRGRGFMVLAVLVAVSAASAGELNADRSKLDPRLRGLVTATGTSPAPVVAPLFLRARGPVRSASVETAVGVVVFGDAVEAARRLGVRVGSVERGFFTASCTPEQIAQLSFDPTVRYIQANRYYKPSLNVSVPEMNIDQVHNGVVNGTPYKGAGVIVGIIDSGIDWKHLDFRSPADTTKSRILFLVDETTNPYTEYTQAQINAELGAAPPGVVQEEDFNGHGTHVAGIAAGNGSSSADGYVGVAPEADLIIVKAGEGSFASTDVINAINYIQHKADSLGKPFSINMSLGGHDGPHDGTTGEELTIDDVLSTPGRAISIAAGNEGSDSIHTDGTVTQGNSLAIDFTVPSYTANSGSQNDYVFFDMWYGGNDNLTVAVKTPQGTTYTATSGSPGGGIETSTSEGAIYIDNASGGTDPLNGSKECIIQVFDNTSTKPPAAGTWQITVTGATVAGSGAFDIWVSGSSIQSSGGYTPEFKTAATFRKLVGQPGTSVSGLTVGAYVTKWSWQASDGFTYNYIGSDRTGNYALFSSMGPSRDGRVKPEISAPGQAIVSAYSSASSAGANVIVTDHVHFVDQGTSMAAPHITGLAALMLEAKPTLTAAEIKSAITSTARQDGFTGSVPSDQWGYGKADGLAVMNAVTSVPLDKSGMPVSFALEQNYPNPFNPSTQITFGIPAGYRGRVELRIVDLLGRTVATLVDGALDAGVHSVTWTPAELSSGPYYYMLRAGKYFEVRKMMLVK